MADERSAVVLLYDASDGTIVHGLTYEVDEGDTLPDRDSLERSAREHGARELVRRAVRTPIESFAALHVDPAEFDHHKRYRVDPETRVLVEVRA